MAQHVRPSRVRPDIAHRDEKAASSAQAHVTVADLDELLDEIDACLEDNAVEVVRMYICRGGQ